MPRISELKPNYMANDIGMIIAGYMKKKRISPKQLGSALGISRQAINYKLDNNSFTYKDIIIIFHELELSSEEILRYVQYK